jgi:hypothetical protein
MRNRRTVVLIASVVAALIGGMQLLSSAAAQNQSSANRVIVVFKNQERSLPATRKLISQRKSAIQGIQAPILSQLSSSGAKNVRSFDVLNAVSATVSKGEESQLKSNPAVSAVVPDQIIRLAPVGRAAQGSAVGTPIPPPPGTCLPSNQAQLEPQALSQIHADDQSHGPGTARSLGITGAGVTVGFIADGLDTDNQDFIRANGQHVFTDFEDFTGEGTNVPTGGGEGFLDASSIAAQGLHTYNIQNYSDLPLSQPCNIRIEGVAPGASLVGLSIFGAEDSGFNSEFLNAINYAVTTDHVNVLNESLGSNLYPDDAASLDLIKQANDAAVAAGTTVTVSSGDAGVTSTIGSPSTDPNVISAGATTTYQLDSQTGYGGARFPGVSGWLDNNISSFSSGGFEQNGRTIDVAAPGELNWALCSTDTNMYGDCFNYAGQPSPVQATGGTSESAPLTAGVAALVIQSYEITHQGQAPSPAVIKQIITSTADDIGAPAEQQGAGLLNAFQAVEAAASYKTTTVNPTPLGQTLLTSQSQLNAIDAPGTAEALHETITNNGASSEMLSLTGRTIGTYVSVGSKSVNIGGLGTKTITDWQGITDNYQKVTFTVPAGENRLNAAISYKNASQTNLAARVRMTLVDPTGKQADYDVPQGDGNYGDSQITNPAAGTWTAYIYSRDKKDGGTTGNVVFNASVAKYASFGTVTPSSVTLAPGQSQPVTLQVTTPAQPGDAAGSIVISDAGAQTTSIPVTLRSLIPAGSQSFINVLTGGNGRAVNTGQMFTYQLDLPAGDPELNADIAVKNAANVFDAWLVSPSGEAIGFSANQIPISNPPGYKDEPGAQLHVLSPAAGRWTLIVLFAPQVAGNAIESPFSVSTNQTSVPVTSTGGLPNSAATTLTAGKPHTFQIKIKNTGAEPELYFPDARLPGSTNLLLGALGGATTTTPVTVNSNIPIYLVPTHTTAIGAQAFTNGSGQIMFDTEAPTGDPDIGSNVGTSVSASFADNPISPGIWDVLPEDAGAFGAAPGPSEAVTTAMAATTSPFDRTVTANTGDLWSAGANPASLAKFNPIQTGPNGTATIPVTITPVGPPGTKVTGTLYIDDANLLVFQRFTSLNGDEVAAIPYSYTVG